MLPYVRIFNAVSVDGRMDRLEADLELYYGIATKWRQDAVLTGSATVLAAIPEVAPEEDSMIPEEVRGDRRPWFIVVDSKGAVRSWHMFRNWPYFRGVMALVSETTPREYLEYLEARRIRYLVRGRDRVDLEGALRALREEHGVKQVRVDSGGGLNGALLRQGLVDEVHLLIHPQAIGGLTPSSIFKAPDLGPGQEPVRLQLKQVRRPKPGFLWLSYRVTKASAQA